MTTCKPSPTFVRDHETDIQALQILLKRPAEWNPAALKQLKRSAARRTGALLRGQPPARLQGRPA